MLKYEYVFLINNYFKTIPIVFKAMISQIVYTVRILYLNWRRAIVHRGYLVEKHVVQERKIITALDCYKYMIPS